MADVPEYRKNRHNSGYHAYTRAVSAVFYEVGTMLHLEKIRQNMLRENLR